MKIKTIKPHNSLLNYIQYYWHIEIDTDDMSKVQRILPGINFELIIEIGSTYYNNGDYKWSKREPNGFLERPINRYFLLRFSSKTKIYGIAFKPLGISSFLHMNLGNIDTLFTSIEAVFGRSGRELVYKVQDSNSFKEVSLHFDKFLLKKLEFITIPKPHVIKACELIMTSSGSIKLSTLTKQLFVSERRLQRDFKEYTGSTMKGIAKSLRFQKALWLIKSNNRLTLDEICIQSGYYDPSHLIRNIMKNTGLPFSSILGSQTALSTALIECSQNLNQ